LDTQAQSVGIEQTKAGKCGTTESVSGDFR